MLPAWAFVQAPGLGIPRRPQGRGEPTESRGLVIVIYLCGAGLGLHSVLIKTSQLALGMAGGWGGGDVGSRREGSRKSVTMGAWPACSRPAHVLRTLLPAQRGPRGLGEAAEVCWGDPTTGCTTGCGANCPPPRPNTSRKAHPVPASGSLGRGGRSGCEAGLRGIPGWVEEEALNCFSLC